MNYTKRDKANVLLGLLGYENKNNRERSYATASRLLEANECNIENIIKLHYSLQGDASTNGSYISLAGEYPTIKIKDSDISNIENHVKSFGINISIG